MPLSGRRAEMLGALWFGLGFVAGGATVWLLLRLSVGNVGIAPGEIAKREAYRRFYSPK
jgi:hypothetical protein